MSHPKRPPNVQVELDRLFDARRSAYEVLYHLYGQTPRDEGAIVRQHNVIEDAHAAWRKAFNVARAAKPTKRVEVNGKTYRWRRGKLVEIPKKWVGKTTFGQQKRRRQPEKRRTRSGP